MYSDDDEYFCTHCGAILNDQYGFDPNGDTWICTCCGQTLYGDNIYDGNKFPGVMWYCDNCGALLNKQSGFSDDCGTWTCTACSYENSISEDEIYASEDEFRASKTAKEDHVASLLADRTVECLSTILHEVFRQKRERQREEERIRQEEERLQQEEARRRREEARSWRKAHRKELCFCTFCLFISLLGCLGYFEYKLLIPVGYASSDLIGIPYQTALGCLEGSGFTSINAIEIQDLSLSELAQDDLVTDVKIAWASQFDSTSRFPSNLKVTLTYHTLNPIAVPFSSSEAKGQDHADIADQLKAAGFANIKEVVLYDIITGWFASDGEVKSVSVAGDTRFDAGAEYRPDAEIIITYHTFKKNKSS
jgi:DNA-directed RNA polymerase subunit M/transcription elongation factor TFIIS